MNRTTRWTSTLCRSLIQIVVLTMSVSSAARAASDADTALTALTKAQGASGGLIVAIGAERDGLYHLPAAAEVHPEVVACLADALGGGVEYEAGCEQYRQGVARAERGEAVEMFEHVEFDLLRWAGAIDFEPAHHVIGCEALGEIGV